MAAQLAASQEGLSSVRKLPPEPTCVQRHIASCYMKQPGGGVRQDGRQLLRRPSVERSLATGVVLIIAFLLALP
jgi:hypothetical protein